MRSRKTAVGLDIGRCELGRAQRHRCRDLPGPGSGEASLNSIALSSLASTAFPDVSNSVSVSILTTCRLSFMTVIGSRSCHSASSSRGAVGARVGVGMAEPAVGLGFDQGRAFAPAGALGCLGHCAAHGQHIHAVHHLAGMP